MLAVFPTSDLHYFLKHEKLSQTPCLFQHCHNSCGSDCKRANWRGGLCQRWHGEELSKFSPVHSAMPALRGTNCCHTLCSSCLCILCTHFVFWNCLQTVFPASDLHCFLCLQPSLPSGSPGQLFSPLWSGFCSNCIIFIVSHWRSFSNHIHSEFLQKHNLEI